MLYYVVLNYYQPIDMQYNVLTFNEYFSFQNRVKFRNSVTNALATRDSRLCGCRQWSLGEAGINRI